ncbi:adhesion G-protein coupled receptor G5-like isoform X3 [Engraulis encrasicolus]|uniref:adhesion G-protein coupled receptor G5-like isoform X3 n=1 Tax=Engraulis encrasicolus TaxID=184585 RepID=UPI002FCEEBC3
MQSPHSGAQQKNRMTKWMLVVALICVLVGEKGSTKGSSRPNPRPESDHGSGQGHWSTNNKGKGRCRQAKGQDFHNNESSRCQKQKGANIEDAKACMEDIIKLMKDKRRHCNTLMKHVKKMEKLLEITQIKQSMSLSKDEIAMHLYKPKKTFRGLHLEANDTKAAAGAVENSSVQVDLPAELLQDGEENTIIFCVIHSAPQFQDLGVLDGRVYGISVSNKSIHGLQQPINISVTLNKQNDLREPECAFYNSTTEDFSKDGCHTVWCKGEGRVTCSCDHLTYFAILMAGGEVDDGHEKPLTYITLIGCSISLTLLLITVILFLIQRRKQSDVSRRVHVNLAAALILLNGHFLPNSWVASLAAPAGCVYIALLLHYSLLATFAWMAVEGFHLYMLLVRVFNIYIRRYLLKLALFAWGVPAVVVLLIFLIDRDAYGLVAIPSESNSTVYMCYVRNDTVKWVSVCVPVALLFLCNGAVLLVTVHKLWRMRADGAPSGGKWKDTCCIMEWKDACCIMAISCMLGLTWAIGLLSSLSLTATYLFCILNSLQGVFISIWFLASQRSQSEDTPSSTNTHTHTT